MIRPFTCICLLMAAGSGLYLYQAKHQTHMVDREIERTLKLADATWQRSGVLRAEYTLLNDPSRLADLAGQYLPTLQTTAPGQFSTMADLDHRLPPVGPPPTDPTLPDVTAAAPDIAAVAPAPQPDVAATATPAAPHAEPGHAEPARVETAHLEPARIEPPHVDQPRLDQPRIDPLKPAASTPARPPASSAEMAPRPVQIAPPRIVQSPPQVARSVLSPVRIAPPVTSLVARAAPVQPPAPAVQIARATPPAPMVGPAPMIGSALGMARTMIQPSAGAPNAISLR